MGWSGWLFGVSGPASACKDPRLRSSIVSPVSRVLCRFFFIFFVAPKILFFFMWLFFLSRNFFVFIVIEVFCYLRVIIFMFVQCVIMGGERFILLCIVLLVFLYG